jgi:PTH1 family peptidyl-tRNA hydrolase
VAEIKLIVGLGNPGKVYENSRHNLGFRAVSGFAKEYKLKFKRSLLFQSLIAHSRIEKETLIICLPLTFMNNSGKAVKKILSRKKIELKNLLVVLDDVNLPFGTLRIRPGGSHGGHNGLNSIIESLGTQQFSRLRLGINNADKKGVLKDFVLSQFSKDEEGALKPFIKKAKSCILAWLREGVVKAMDNFN